MYTDSLTTRFPEFQRVASNRPKQGMPEHLPKNTDGTTSSIVHKTPRRVVQKIPTGKVNGAEPDWLLTVSDYILTEKIIKNANSQYELIEKCWQMIEGSLTRGFATWYCPLVSKGDYIGPDMTLPYWGDVYIQPGKLSDKDANYMFVRSWWREEDIDSLIDRIGKMSKDDATESGWDIGVLKEIKTHEQTKDDKAQTQTDRSQAVNQRGGVELITGFQRGIGSEFITFHRETHTIARTKDNKDPRGEWPLGFNYCETDGTNPFGRGFVEAVLPLQNLMDSDDQMYQFNRALMLGPPVKKRGNYNKTQLQLIPNAIWDMGTNPGNDAEPVNIDSSALTNYPQLYQLNQSRIFQLLAAPNAQTQASSGTVGASKTTAGVNQTTANLSIDDNFIRKKFEAAFQEWCECAINLWFAEHTGIEELQLDDDTAMRLRVLKNFDQSMLSDDNKVVINYDDETSALSFKVDASTSRAADDTEQVALYQQSASMLTPQFVWFMGQDGWKVDVGQYWLNMFTHMHMSGIDKVITKMNDQESAQAKQSPFPIIDPPKIQLRGQVPPNAMAAALSRGGVDIPPGTQLQDTPTDLMKIYNDPTTPATVKAQIMQLAGLQPDPVALQDAQDTEATTHMQNQAAGVTGAAASLMPAPPTEDPNVTPSAGPSNDKSQPSESGEPAPQENAEATLAPGDEAVIEHLEQLGLPADKVNQAIGLLKTGATPEDILKHLGLQQ